jgi:hypothetical protein
MLEIVRPILQLLKPENTAMENFEALMALTNLASIGESVRYEYTSPLLSDFLFRRDEKPFFRS